MRGSRKIGHGRQQGHADIAGGTGTACHLAVFAGMVVVSVTGGMILHRTRCLGMVMRGMVVMMHIALHRGHMFHLNRWRMHGRRTGGLHGRSPALHRQGQCEQVQQGNVQEPLHGVQSSTEKSQRAAGAWLLRVSFEIGMQYADDLFQFLPPLRFGKCAGAQMLTHVAFQNLPHQPIGGASYRGDLLQDGSAVGAGLERMFDGLYLPFHAAHPRQQLLVSDGVAHLFTQAVIYWGAVYFNQACLA